MFSWLFKKKAPTEPDRSTLVPRIKSLEFTAALQQMGIPDDQLPYTEPLVADLLVTYAFDLPGLFQMASLEAIAEVGVPQSEIREVALDNLRRQMPEIGMQEVGPMLRIVTQGENLEACSLLATSFWNQAATQMPGEVVAVAPSRDIVLFGTSESQEAIDAMRELASEVMGQAGRHGLSEQLLVWRGQRWAEFD